MCSAVQQFFNFHQRLNPWTPAFGLQASATRHTNQKTVKYIFTCQWRLQNSSVSQGHHVVSLYVGGVWACSSMTLHDYLPTTTTVWKLPKLVWWQAEWKPQLRSRCFCKKTPGWMFPPERYKREWSSWQLSLYRCGFNLWVNSENALSQTQRNMLKTQRGSRK